MDLLLAVYYATEKSTRQFKNQHTFSQKPNGVTPFGDLGLEIWLKKWGLKKCTDDVNWIQLSKKNV